MTSKTRDKCTSYTFVFVFIYSSLIFGLSSTSGKYGLMPCRRRANDTLPCSIKKKVKFENEYFVTLPYTLFLPKSPYSCYNLQSKPHTFLYCSRFCSNIDK